MDSFEGQDPFDGDGYMAKGRHMQMQADCSTSDVLQQYLKAMAHYRCVQALHTTIAGCGLHAEHNSLPFLE